MSDTRKPTAHLTLPLAPEAITTHIHVEDEGCHSTYDDRGNPTDAEQLAETLRCTLPGNLYEGLLRAMLREELEYAREMGEHARSEVWYSAYMLLAGDPDAAFAPWRTVQECYKRLEQYEKGVTDAVA